jgi:cell division protein FtsI/penicillin-binding protein 2
MGLVGFGLLVQLVRVQFGPYAPVFDYLSRASLGRVERVVPDRGLIYDRDGVVLAANSSRYHLEVEIRQLSDRSREQIETVLSKLLVLPLEDLHDQLARDWIAGGQYRIRLTRQDENQRRWPIIVDGTVADVLSGFLQDPAAPDLTGLSLEPAPHRVYPSGTLTGHLIGFVNQESRGFFGVEGYYDEWLSGKSITIERPLIPPEARLEPDPPAGVNLVLTIDLDIQQVADTALREAIDSSKAESGQVIVMDPRNGEILAMAAWPNLDPATYESWLESDAGGEDDRSVIAPAVAGQFEPGSTFKVLVMAAALDAGVVTPDEIFLDTGTIEIGGHVIRNWNGGAWGPQTMLGCLQHSLNVCLAWVGAKELGASNLYNYLNSFGIGQLTGIDLAGEVAGQLRTPRDPRWTESDLGTNSFGQGVSTTPIQLLAAIGAIANGGAMVQPHIVREVVGPQGVYWPQPVVLNRPVRPETAAVLTEMLATSLELETTYAHVEGYRIAGKTGTAQVPGEFGYDPRWTIASFVGWGPVADPRFIVFVRLDKPQSSPWGSVVAAPVFQEIVERLVVLLEIPPDSIRAAMAPGG